jgi:hypothetical protein
MHGDPTHREPQHQLEVLSGAKGLVEESRRNKPMVPDERRRQRNGAVA